MYKLKEPQETISFIRDILYQMHITTFEKIWFSKSSNIHSCRVEICGSNLGANGKGITIEFALASAYAELMERLQTFHFFHSCEFPEESIEEYGFQFDPREVEIEAENIKELPNSFKNSFMFNNSYSTFDYWIDNYIEKREHRKKKIKYMPFYNIIEKKEELLPAFLVYMMNGSNGLCAGNNREEALSQGLSEIFERYIQKRAFLDQSFVPSISREYLEKKFYFELELIKTIERKSNYHIIVKDFTYNNKYPVIGIVIINKSNHKFSVSLGADPDLRIALQRCLTEIFQGDLYLEYKSNYLTDSVFVENIALEYNKQLKNSSGTWDYSILVEAEFTQPTVKTFHTLSEKYDYLVDVIKTCNVRDVYIRDCSYTGFGSYQIIIPGYSEAFIFNENRKKVTPYSLREIEYYLKRQEQGILLNLLEDFLLRINEFLMGDCFLEHLFLKAGDGEIYKTTWFYLLFLVYSSLGKNETALKYLDLHINMLEELEYKEVFECLYNLVYLNTNDIELLSARYTLLQMFREEVVNIATYIKQHLADSIVYIEKDENNDLEGCYLKVKDWICTNYKTSEVI